MKVITHSDEVFACYERSCAPPPTGKGGSGKGGRKGAVGRAAVASQVAGTKAKMKGYSEASKTYGTDEGKGFSKATGRSASPETRKAVKDQIDKWMKSGKPGDQRDEKSTAKMLTDKYGTRGTGKGKNIKKHSDFDEAARQALELTKRFGGRNSGNNKGDGRSGGWNPSDK